LVFTTLMSPWAKTDGELSRFTCETCHFEGIADGRTHHTGRGEVHATTKPLAGLFVNEPHFTRALDEDMAKMISSEFRVASSNTDHSPVFCLDEVDGSPGLPSGFRAAFGGDAVNLDRSPVGMRKALMEFLRDFGPRKNPRTVGRANFTEEERTGAAVFHDLCVSCHSARLVANDSHSEVPFEEWEREIFAEDRIVWARDGREKTGIEPYVHPDGARPTSLRRLARKRPYFTNGSSPTLSDVLLRVWVGDPLVAHARTTEGGRPLTGDEIRDLSAFLEIL
jgi:cytochrome c peroxidase